MTTHLQTVQVIVLFLLFLVAIFAAIAQRIKIPYPILLTIAGVCIAFVPHVPRIPLDPNLVFLIFLPFCRIKSLVPVRVIIVVLVHFLVHFPG